MSAVLLLAALIAAVCDWWSVSTQRQNVEQLAKPLVMLCLIAAVLVSSDLDFLVRVFVLGALSLGLAGDVFLLPQYDRFLAGLASFAVGHVLFIAAFLQYSLERSGLFLGAAVGLVLVSTLGRRIVAATRGSALHVPVMAYIAIIAVMVLTGIGTPSRVIAVGSALFAASDALLGWDRFVAVRDDRRVWVHVMYHLGQTAIVAGLVT